MRAVFLTKGMDRDRLLHLVELLVAGLGVLDRRMEAMAATMQDIKADMASLETGVDALIAAKNAAVSAPASDVDMADVKASIDRIAGKVSAALALVADPVAAAAGSGGSQGSQAGA